MNENNTNQNTNSANSNNNNNVPPLGKTLRQIQDEQKNKSNQNTNNSAVQNQSASSMDKNNQNKPQTYGQMRENKNTNNTNNQQYNNVPTGNTNNQIQGLGSTQNTNTNMNQQLSSNLGASNNSSFQNNISNLNNNKNNNSTTQSNSSSSAVPDLNSNQNNSNVGANSSTSAMNNQGVKFESGPKLTNNQNQANNKGSSSLPPLEKEVVEKVKYKKKGPGCNPFAWIAKIRRMIFTGCLLLILFIIGFVLILIFRPPLLWDPVKSFLNNGYNPPIEEDQEQTNIREFIDEQISLNEDGNSGSIIISESQASYLVSQRFSSGTQGVDIEEGTLTIFIDAESESEKPLWLILEFQEGENNEFNITKLGFGRFDLPDGVNDVIAGALFRTFNITQGDLTGEDSIDIFAFIAQNNTDTPINVTDVVLLNDQMEISYEVIEE